MGRSFRVAGLFVFLTTAGLGAWQGAPPALKPLVPAAASSIVADPDAFVGQTVSVTAVVERILSPTSFAVGQRPQQEGAGELLVLVELLNAPLAVDTYVTVIGEVVRDEGRLAIRATSVITRDMVDLAKPIPPPMTPEESAFEAAMKRIGPAFNTVRTAVTASGGDSLKAEVATLTEGFETAETFWKGRGVVDAQKWAAEARAHARSIEQAVAASRWDDAKAAVSALQQTCSACHGAYRERQDDGSYRIRVGK